MIGPLALVGLVFAGFQTGYIQSALMYIGIGITLLVALYVILWIISSISDASAKAEAERLSAIHLIAAEARITYIVTSHLPTLVRRRTTLVQVDRYGVVDKKAWNREINHFIENVVRPQLPIEESHAVIDAGITGVFQRLVKDRVEAHTESDYVPAVLSPSTTPSEFESLCASILRQAGWVAHTTKASGDQGADVIAEKGGKKLVVQCKLYTGVVGNKSVQEVLSAKYHYGADFAAVVTNSEFTKSAKELAKTTKVDLISYVEMDLYSQKLIS